MTLTRERLMKLLVEKPKIPFSEFEDIVGFAINHLDDTYAVRMAKAQVYDAAIKTIDERINFYVRNIDDLKKILPPTGETRIHLLGKIGEFVEIKEELLKVAKRLRQQKADEMDSPQPAPIQ